MSLFSDRLEQHFYNAFCSKDNLYCATVIPSGLQEPRWVSVNRRLAEQLGIDPAELSNPVLLDMMSGNAVPAHLNPIALVYSGHQFGVWAGQLGDGRAMTLGELSVGPDGELWDIQLKGAGTTPYSRFADGRAVLRSSIREYLCSEAMHGLGIATTRALCLVDSKTAVYREEVEPGATVCRVARSHIRFGSFEHFHYRNQPESVRALADYLIQRQFPEWREDDNRYLNLFENAVTQTAIMVAHWQSVGFCHGVMNTDNMSIIGDTIDYGPFGFLDRYDPEFICNHSDSGGRYSFKNQPSIGWWNLNALATALMSVLESEQLIAVLKTYEPTFLSHYRALMAAKIGLESVAEGDEQLINQLLELMQRNSVDYTLFFRSLCNFNDADQSVRDHFIDRDGFDQWANMYLQRLQRQAWSDGQRRDQMRKVNPKYVLRNYMAQAAIEKAYAGDYSEVELLLTVLQSPFEEHPEAHHYAGLPPDWAEKISVSCSS